MTLGKLMGFLGITADITGFSLDSDVLMIGVVFAAFLQILKSETAVENRAILEQKRKENTKRS